MTYHSLFYALLASLGECRGLWVYSLPLLAF